MRSVGLHLRLTHTMYDLALQAKHFGLRTFQCFCITQSTNKMYVPTAQEIAHFLTIRASFDQLYLHGSYWINLARDKSNALRILRREVTFAKNHEFTHIIIHPGSAVEGTKKSEAIEIVARMLNDICKLEQGIYFVLENTTHANTSVGSNFDDFVHLMQKIEFPERIGFCIDTAHAHEYGYTLNTQPGLEQFIALLDRSLGFKNIMLLHINDTKQKKGSRIDHHAPIGEGELGINWLQAFAMHTELKKIPIILELPSSLSDEKQQEMLSLVQQWK